MGLVPAGSGGTGQGQSGSSPFPSGGGGGHGGYGGASGLSAAGGNSYDSITRPVLAGSVGGNGSGNAPNNLGGAAGGALQLAVGGKLSLSGIISANGKPGVGQWSGGGSGGSVYITATLVLKGQELFRRMAAREEIQSTAEAAEGGRISITYGSKTFAGSVSARGGSGTNYGGAGTVYWQSASNSFGQVVRRQSAGFPGTNTPLALTSPSQDLTDRAAVQAYAGGEHHVADDRKSCDRIPTVFLSFTSPYSRREALSQFLSNLTIQTGGGITLDGQGSSPSGTAALNSTGSGGGYGGYGGNSTTNSRRVETHTAQSLPPLTSAARALSASSARRRLRREAGRFTSPSAES